ncbi:Elongation factor G [Fragilaria crotonensis]|nr:Elongation factor G [Fragilaria crotonensis]
MADADQDLYDEFGNYIGPDLDSDDDSDDDDDEEEQAPDDASDVSADQDQKMVLVEDDEQDGQADPVQAIVLHEDKVHYPSANQVYGDDVRTAVLDEDAIDLNVPLVEPVSTKTNRAKNTEADDYIYTDNYLTALFGNETTRVRRGFALVGHLHSGKTTFVDLLLETTKRHKWGSNSNGEQDNASSQNAREGPRYADQMESEQARQMSLVSTPISTILPDTRGKSYLVTLVDCPGHVNFHDESVAALRAVDGAVVVLDAIEGIMLHTEMVVRHAVSEGLPITLLINKVDRLIVELKLPPRDCYYKLLHLVESVNDLVAQASNGRYPKISPDRGNVAFASAQHGWCFTLQSFANLYLDHLCEDGLGDNLGADDFAKRLWGNSYLDPETRLFHKSARNCQSPGVERTFCTFVLEPLYKLYSACLAEREQDVNKLLRKVGVLLRRDELRASARTLLRAALSKFFETATSGFVDMVVQHFPSPSAAAKGKVALCYSGLQDGKVAQAMLECDSQGPLMMHVVKLYASEDGQNFSAFGRIYSGSVRPGERVRVLGEGYSPEDDEEDMCIATVGAVAIPRGRIQTLVSRATAGNWVLLEGIEATISKTATIASISTKEEDEVHIFAPLKFPQAGGDSVMKLAIEPLNPGELPKMVEGLRRISKAYPMAKTRVEESGEHVLFGTGELYMDCMMHDLRHVYSDIEVKVSDPIVGFRETVIETSSLKCFAETANKRNKLTFIAEPLDDGLAEMLEAGKINQVGTPASRDGSFRRNLIGIFFLLGLEVDKNLLKTCKSSIVQGFQWATREGPLCEEPVRGTKIRILNASLADKPIHRGGGQIIPTARRTVHSALLTATPRLMEPIYRLQIQCPGDMVDSIQPILTRRRGHIVQDRPISGSMLYSVKGFIPVLDSFGFETDLRTFTQGQAMVHAVFDHWNVVPGDPLDKNIILHPLEPSPPPHLARELLIKTRRRKGLSEDVSISKFFDDGMRAHLVQDQPIDAALQ